MQIPRYWASVKLQARHAREGKIYTMQVWGWSDESEAMARREAEKRRDALASKIAAGEELKRYEYGSEYPLREPILETLEQAGVCYGIVTRNRYGAVVLNTEDVMFADIDLFQDEDLKEKPRSFLEVIPFVRAWAQKNRQERAARIQEVWSRRLDKIIDWSRRYPKRSFRVYRTFAGYRLLFLNERLDARNPENLEILSQLDCDPLYIRLCRHQGCYRARLTPKPWRMGLYAPYVSWPFRDNDTEERYRNYIDELYEKERRKYATCKFVRTLGSGRPDRLAQAVADYHDRVCRVDSHLPLA